MVDRRQKPSRITFPTIGLCRRRGDTNRQRVDSWNSSVRLDGFARSFGNRSNPLERIVGIISDNLTAMWLVLSGLSAVHKRAVLMSFKWLVA